MFASTAGAVLVPAGAVLRPLRAYAKLRWHRAGKIVSGAAGKTGKMVDDGAIDFARGRSVCRSDLGRVAQPS